jgi:cell wall-associated NlpC family hydrolase
MAVSRDMIVACARSYCGVPFVHQGRTKEGGVDCAGLVICVAKELGLSSFDVTDYPASPDPQMMRKHLREQLDEIGFKSALPGDILWMRQDLEPQHLGIVTMLEPEVTMVHAFSKKPMTCCIEQPLGRVWRQKVIATFRFRGVA